MRQIIQYIECGGYWIGGQGLDPSICPEDTKRAFIEYSLFATPSQAWDPLQCLGGFGGVSNGQEARYLIGDRVYGSDMTDLTGGGCPILWEPARVLVGGCPMLWGPCPSLVGGGSNTDGDTRPGHGEVWGFSWVRWVRWGTCGGGVLIRGWPYMGDGRWWGTWGTWGIGRPGVGRDMGTWWGWGHGLTRGYGDQQIIHPHRI
jgi:hypothetical protein